MGMMFFAINNTPKNYDSYSKKKKILYRSLTLIPIFVAGLTVGPLQNSGFTNSWNNIFLGLLIAAPLTYSLQRLARKKGFIPAPLFRKK